MPKFHKIPDRWLDYEPFGDAIRGTQILPLKVPLNETLCSRVPADKRFTPDDLFRRLEERNYKLGILIDLTATTRYYNYNTFTDRDVQYVKIFTQGHVVPSPDVIEKFSSAIAKYEEANSNTDLLIGVHCTHGVNRTGYLICRYLIEHKGFEPENALQAFAKARGYPVERENYIQNLLSLPQELQRTHTLEKEEHMHKFSNSSRRYDQRTSIPYNSGDGHSFDTPSWRGHANHAIQERDLPDTQQHNGRVRQDGYRQSYGREQAWNDSFNNRGDRWSRDESFRRDTWRHHSDRCPGANWKGQHRDRFTYEDFTNGGQEKWGRDSHRERSDQSARSPWNGSGSRGQGGQMWAYGGGWTAGERGGHMGLHPNHIGAIGHNGPERAGHIGLHPYHIGVTRHNGSSRTWKKDVQFGDTRH